MAENVPVIQAPLYAQCLAFVQEQSGGEWGDALEAQDAAKLAAFVHLHRLAAEADALERCSGIIRRHNVGNNSISGEHSNLNAILREIGALASQEPTHG